jgi:hypothetical protein
MTEELTMAKAGKLTRNGIERARRLLLEHEDELLALLNRCNTRESRDEGIPAILIVDDFTQAEKPGMVPPLDDEGLGTFYADLSLALAVLVESRGGDPYYPSICPAMSAIAEQTFGTWCFSAWQTGSEGD